MNKRAELNINAELNMSFVFFLHFITDAAGPNSMKLHCRYGIYTDDRKLAWISRRRLSSCLLAAALGDSRNRFALLPAMAAESSKAKSSKKAGAPKKAADI
ncbi:hypothetical protein Vretimale_13292 [Volvox reticuliferus]|uniref:Uncharacterized protein n=1 Tax=Volvox reticuliferus TaxID=1737510 RepID=A0A8J4CLH5_9CHLO|nr:hypothetical protein Vretifemale_14145 [Volvox reticuliferus]GIM09436.1 hypothetical protein Vretimale_13292 [Volvox reticuliferus]